MAGSAVRNLQLDPKKQKIVECNVCEQPLVVGKFSKNYQTCETAGYYPSQCPYRDKAIKENKKSKASKKSKSARDKIKKEKDSIIEEDKSVNEPSSEFAKRLTEIMNDLEFNIDQKRRYFKKYAVDGGGVITIYPHIEPGVAGTTPKLEWFSVILQRAVGTNEEFRRFMPPDASYDCEVLSSEFGQYDVVKPQVGTAKCDSCGSMTDEFGVDTRYNKVYCVKPNNCFKKHHTNAGAQSEV